MIDLAETNEKTLQASMGTFAKPGRGGEVEGAGSSITFLEDSELSNIIGSFEPLKGLFTFIEVFSWEY